MTISGYTVNSNEASVEPTTGIPGTANAASIAVVLAMIGVFFLLTS